jgi:hypothetical protein
MIFSSKRKIYILFTLFLYSGLLFSANTNTIDLSGKWGFAMDEKELGVTEKWYEHSLSNVINLPGSMVESNKGYDLSLTTKFTASIYDSSWYFNPKMAKYRTLDNLKMPFWLTQKKHYIGLAWYQKEVYILLHVFGLII